MKVTCYLIVQGQKPKYGFDKENQREPGAIRITKNKPSTARDEIAVKLDIDIPDALFIKPTLSASIRVPDDGGRGPEITAEVAENISEIIRQKTGVTVYLSGPEQEE